MKLSKTSWLILTLGIFIVAFASLGIAHYQQAHQQDQLEDQLAVAERRLNKLQLKQLYSQREEVEEQLNQTISQFEAAKAVLSQPAESINISDTLFRIAEACGVEVTAISSSGPARGGDLEGVTCSVLPVTIMVEGDVPNLLSFVIKLNDDFATSVVESVGIGVQEQVEEEIGAEGIEGEAEKSSADIQLIVYSYQGG